MSSLVISRAKCFITSVPVFSTTLFYGSHPNLYRLPLNFKQPLKVSHWNSKRWSGFHRQADLGGNFSLRRLWKPLGFTIAVSGFSLVGAAIWQYENVRHEALTKTKWFTKHSPKYGEFRQHIHRWWHNRSAADKIFYTICSMNLLVFLAWRVPVWQTAMSTYFLMGLSKNALCWPMLLSVFSHSNIIHLGANMVVLQSFSEKAVSALGKEQFVAVYLLAGVISSFTSYLFKALIRSNALSLGASGAVMGVLGFVCTKYPDTQLAVIFLPQFPFNAGSGLAAILGLDIAGCILKWGVLDHAAHLGGSLFGIMWSYWGNDFLWKRREPLVTAWHKLRGPIT